MSTMMHEVFTISQDINAGQLQHYFRSEDTLFSVILVCCSWTKQIKVVHYLIQTRGYRQKASTVMKYMVCTKTHKRLNGMLFNYTKQEGMQIFEGILFFKATNNTQNKQIT